MPNVVPGYTGGGWVGRSGYTETRDLIFLLFLISFCHRRPSLTLFFPTAVFVHNLSIGLVPPSFRARLNRRGITLKDAQGWTLDKISIQTRHTSRNTRSQQPACKCHAGTLECTVASVAR